MKWEKVSSEWPLADDWLTVRRDVCRMPDGQIVDPYYVLERPDYCMVFPVTRDNEVILVEQYRHGAGVVSLELPGGLFEPGEQDAERSARRELLEETGYGGGEFELIGTLYPNPAVQNNTAYCFLAKNVKPVSGQALDENEDIVVRTVPLGEVRELVLSSKIKHAVHLGCIFLALEKLSR